MRSLLVLAGAAMALPAAHAADTYQVDPNHASATFQYRHLGLDTFTGKVSGVSGTIILDPAAKTGSVDIKLDPATVVTGVPKFDERLRSSDFFDAKRFPLITFVSHEVEFAGAKPRSLKGDLTLHGITKPVTLRVTRFVCSSSPRDEKPLCGADAVTTVKRSDFGMQQIFLPASGDVITVTLNIEAVRN